MPKPKRKRFVRKKRITPAGKKNIRKNQRRLLENQVLVNCRTILEKHPKLDADLMTKLMVEQHKLFVGLRDKKQIGEALKNQKRLGNSVVKRFLAPSKEETYFIDILLKDEKGLTIKKRAELMVKYFEDKGSFLANAKSKVIGVLGSITEKTASLGKEYRKAAGIIQARMSEHVEGKTKEFIEKGITNNLFFEGEEQMFNSVFILSEVPKLCVSYIQDMK